MKAKHTQKTGRPTVLNKQELAMANHLSVTAKWEFPYNARDIITLEKLIRTSKNELLNDFKIIYLDQTR